MHLFARKPRTKTQRERWLLLVRLVENNQFTNVDDIRTELARHGYGISEPTALNDLRMCNISKIGGTYVVVPYTAQQEVEDILRFRMRASVLQLFQKDDIVILNCHAGAGGWVANTLRELEDDHIMSILDGPSTVWIMTDEGCGESLYDKLHAWFMEART